MPLPSFPARPAQPRCAAWRGSTRPCRGRGWHPCRGGCGRAFCGHHNPRMIPFGDDRAPQHLRGTVLCYRCLRLLDAIAAEDRTRTRMVAMVGDAYRTGRWQAASQAERDQTRRNFLMVRGRIGRFRRELREVPR